MLAAGPSTQARASTATTAAVDVSETDDFLTAVLLQLEELGIETESRKGKERSGHQPDRHLALEDYKNALEGLSTFHADRRMAQSIADAVDQDASTIAEIVAVETTAARDREQVLRMENVTPRSTSTVPIDDTVSVFEDYETQASIPSHVLETPAFPEDYTYGSTQAGSSSQPQKKGAEYFAGPKVRCSSCLDHVLQTYNIKCSSDHLYCRDCLRKYIFTAMKDETIYPLKCCRTEASQDAITAVLTPAEYQRYIDVGTEYSTANRLYCTNKRCLKFIPPSRISNNIGTCELCDTRVCSNCKLQEHTGACQRDDGFDSVLATAEVEGWRRCSRCQQMIELGQGCYHMTCPCKAEFCYLCGVEWKHCTCPVWEERRLHDAAVARVERDAHQDEVIPPVVRNQRIERAQRQIEQNHQCWHPGKFERRTDYRRRGYVCDICNDRHWKYILVCRGCGLFACEMCRRFRV